MTRTLAALVLAVLVGALPGAASVAAAADLVCPPPADAPGPAGFQVWLDRDVASTDAPPGGTVEVGFTLWDPRQRELLGVSGLEACLHPAAGGAAPEPGRVRSDFPGHLLVEFTVPAGSAGQVQLGSPGQVCASDGSCAATLLPIPIAGTGPPPDADPSLLLAATIHLAAGDVEVGRPVELLVDVVPRGLWEPAALDLPAQLVVTAARRGEAPVATAEIRSSDASSLGEHRGSLTLAEPGEFTLRVAVRGDDGVDRAIDGSDVVLRVGDAAVSGSSQTIPGSSPSPATPSETTGDPGIPAIAWILGVGALLAGAGLLARRGLSNL